VSQPPSSAHATRAPETATTVARVREALRMALLIPVLAIGALCALLAWQVRALSEHNRWVAQTHQVIAQTWRVEKLLIDHETGLRARILTGDDAFLAPYTAARAELPGAFDHLGRLAADNTLDKARVEDLRARHEDWLRNAEAAISRSRETRNSVEPGLLEEMRVRKGMMDAMRATVDRILSDADRLLEERELATRRATRRLFVAGGVTALILGIAAAFFLHRLVRSLDASYAEAFRAQSEALRVAEALAAEVTEQLQSAMDTILEARAAQQKAEARAAELERGPR
jgi:methyl-accepting chemotaxis protein